MRVGLFLNAQFPAGDDVIARVPELVAQVRLARQCGFASLSFPHLFLTAPLRMLQLYTAMAYLLPVAKGMLTGPNILILPATRLGAVAQQMQIYCAALAKAGRTPGAYPIIRECYVGAATRRRWRNAADRCNPNTTSTRPWGTEAYEKPPFEVYARDRFIIGDAAFMKQEVARYRETPGVDHFMMRCHWPGLEQDKVPGSIRRLGEILGSP